jgi:2-polyprenyl-3-methyl-5-hydroxy-6-metoxy-1,4-benzoquinol methylase
MDRFVAPLPKKRKERLTNASQPSNLKIETPVETPEADENNGRHVKVDGRLFNTTQLKSTGHGATLHRDYSAHFFRWSFVRRHIEKGCRVLDVGCGQELPLYKILTSALGAYRPASYTGVDLNLITKKPTSQNIDVKIFDKFNVVDRPNELSKCGYDVITCFEVIEHMSVADGLKLLKIFKELLAPKGRIFLSTPVFNGSAAKNHIHEYTIAELSDAINTAGLRWTRRYGTFMNISNFKTMAEVHQITCEALGQYFDDDALSCIFAVLCPDRARNNLWIITAK